ncbi:MAG TPA: hypothetical protein VF070_04925 [Streptosporangiaceae bacterium]
MTRMTFGDLERTAYGGLSATAPSSRAGVLRHDEEQTVRAW